MTLFTILIILILFYLFLIAPRILHRPDYSNLFGVYYAHRGFHDNTSDSPENSMAAFKKAVHLGYGIELDVQLTKDRIPVIFHDETLKRACGASGMIKDYSFEELQKFTLFSSSEKIPLFEDFLKMVNGQVPLIIEIKCHENPSILCEVTNKYLENYMGSYCIESFHPLAVKWYKEHRPEIIRGQLSTDFLTPKKLEYIYETLVHYLLTNCICRPDFIAYDHLHKNNISRLVCKNLFGALGVTWTIKSQKQLENCRKDFSLFIFEGFTPDSK